MKPNILVIEDDQPLCWLIEAILGDDFEVTIKREGVSAMEWLMVGNIPDLILCDNNLPKITGLEFLRNLSKSGAFKKIPFIMSSSFTDDSLKKKLVEAGANQILEKPFDPPELIASINAVLKTENISNKNS